MPSCSQRVGTPNAQHNLSNTYRKNLENVNPELSKYNEIVRLKSVEEIYKEHLQPAFEKFNEKQKRRDRRLDVKYNCDTYLGYQRALDKQAQASDNAIDKKGRPPIRELILQFGNPEQGYGCAGQTDESREQKKQMLLEAQREIEVRYPQLIFGDCVFHADEESLDAEGKQLGSLHLHTSFVPLCYDNKRGPEVQVAFERCLNEMGFSSFEAWKHDLDNVMETVLQKHGLERTVMGNTNEHQESKQFHRQQKLIKQTRELDSQYGKVEIELAATRKELTVARKSFYEIKQVISSMKDEKSVLDGEISVLEEKKEKVCSDTERAKNFLKTNEPLIRKYAGEIKEINKILPEMRQQKAEMEQELPVLQEQIIEVRTEIANAKSELELVESAIKRKMDEGQGQFGWDGMAERIERARKDAEKDKKIKELEERLSMFEAFVSHPQVRPIWEQLRHLFQRDKKKKIDRADRV